MFAYMNEVSQAEQDKIKKVIQELFRQTCILKIKYNPETLIAKDNEKYYICNKHREFIADYLEILGCELQHDSQEHIFRIVGEGVPVLRISLHTTKILLLLKLIYREKMLGEGLHASVTNLKEIRTYGANTGLLTGKFTTSEWSETLNLMKRHQILEIPGSVANVEDDTPLYIYSTINIYCPSREINDLIAQYKEETEEGERLENEGEEGIQTVMFD
ncbi:putative uncharacterized protein [Clostridium sp. CAG:411]|jgi:hypothetical protein|nr:DUF4194 domain-containing protein [Lachnospiraceae bacterium]CDE43453.1 putative uncharacterized protein [Clostridium sp. CAG:411]